MSLDAQPRRPEAGAGGEQSDGEEDRSPVCPVCGLRYRNYQGRRVHERYAHPEAFHTKEADRLGLQTKRRWSPEEVSLMAAFERDHPGRAREINELIRAEVLPHRTLEAIKGKRKQQAYKSVLADMVERAAIPRGDGSPRRAAAPTPPPGERQAGGRPRASLPPPSPPLETEEGEGTPPAQVVPPPPPPDPLATLDLTVRELSERLGVEVPVTLEMLQHQLDIWSPPPLVPTRPGRGRDGVRPPPPRNNRQRRRQEYALFQKSWGKDRGRAVRRVLAGQALTEGREEKPEGTTDFWKNLFQRRSPAEVPMRLAPEKPQVGHRLYAPVVEDEVRAALRATKANTASGPDGRKRSDLEALGPEKLRWLMNAALRLQNLPEEWMRGRTVLLPKVDVPQSPSDFRPLTITPVLTRTLHRVLAKRLNTLAPLPLSQKGFRKEEGCAANLLLVRQALRHAKAGPRSLYMAFIDFKKAFDSVGHPAIAQACDRWGLGAEFRSYVRNIYGQAKTKLDEETEATISRGVLQGDPMSPALFNMTLDWALSALPEEVGVEIGGVKRSYLAFADDVLLLATTPMGLRKSVAALVRAAGELGLEVGVAKCATLGIRADGKRKAWVQDSIRIEADGEPIRCLSPGKFYKYLGIQVGSNWAGGPSHLLARYVTGLGRLQRCPAKPQQKLWSLTNVLIPQLLYPLLHAEANKGALKRLDRESRQFVRTALHLPKDTPIGYFHAAVVDGGLGVASMETRIPRMREDLLVRLQRSHDPAVAAVAGANAEIPLGPASGRRAREKAHWSTSLYGSVDGKGLEGIKNTPVSSTWISDGTTLMPGWVYVRAVKLRGGLLPTPLRSARGRQEPAVHCDLCYGRRVCSLGHILQQCPATAGSRTKRHDGLLDHYVTELQHQGYQVKKEPAIPTQAGTRYPDIVCWSEGGSHVIDVQVVADAAAGDLEGAHRLKVEKYSSPAIRDYVSQLTGHPPVIETFTCSWRGVVCPSTVNSWTSLGLPKSRLKLMVVKCLEGGAAIYREHKDTSGPRVGRPGPS